MSISLVVLESNGHDIQLQTLTRGKRQTHSSSLAWPGLQLLNIAPIGTIGTLLLEQNCSNSNDVCYYWVTSHVIIGSLQW